MLLALRAGVIESNVVMPVPLAVNEEGRSIIIGHHVLTSSVEPFLPHRKLVDHAYQFLRSAEAQRPDSYLALLPQGLLQQVCRAHGFALCVVCVCVCLCAVVWTLLTVAARLTHRVAPALSAAHAEELLRA